LANNNTNAGGNHIVAGARQINLQAQGLYENVQQIEDTLIKPQGGAAIHVKDIAVVEQGPKFRLGQISKTYRDKDRKLIDSPDVVEGSVLLRKGADADSVLGGIEERVLKVNDHILPMSVRFVPFLDRIELVHLTTHSVLHNLTEGIVLVSIILLSFWAMCAERSSSPPQFRLLCCSHPFA
jgi:cobalt-zinc-cadmium resistance protein CzcA